MKRILLGFAFILFGILLLLVVPAGGLWLPFVGSPSANSIVLIGLVCGVVGLVIVIVNSRDWNKKE